jgi:hypothetical protein
MISRPVRFGGAAVLTGMLLWAGSAAVGGQSSATMPASPAAGTQQESPQGSRFASGSGASTPGSVSVRPATTRGSNAQRAYRKMLASPNSPATTFCFKPGVGWIRRSPLLQGTGTGAWQAVPLSMAAPFAAARRLPQPGKGDNCAATGSGASALLLAGEGQAGESDQESPGNAPNGNAPGRSQNSSGGSAASPESSEIMTDPDTGQPVYSFGESTTANLVPLGTSFSSQGEFFIRIPPPLRPMIRLREADYLKRNPGLPADDLFLGQEAIENHAFAMPIAAFSPGEAAGPGLTAGSAQSEAFEAGRSLWIDTRPAYLHFGKQPAEVITPQMADEFHHLRGACARVTEAVENRLGGSVPEAGRGFVSTTQAEELNRLRRTCADLARMSRREALKRIAKHRSSH